MLIHQNRIYKNLLGKEDMCYCHIYQICLQTCHHILDTLAKKGEETVEQGKVLNKELKHNVKSTIKDYKASNGKMHTVHEAEVVEAEVVEDDDIPGSATEVEDVDDHEETETEEAETDSKMETVEETETEEE